MAGWEWTKGSYEASVSSRCWWFTPYDDGWDGSARHGPAVADDGELRGIVAMEATLAPVPAWAARVVETAIRCVAPCGHANFPLSYLEAVGAIGAGQPPPLIHTCFTVDRARKERMADYALCLDGWLAGAGPGMVAPELSARSDRIDWPVVCRGLWQALGERTELKALLVERVLLQLRHGMKSMVWDDDQRGHWCSDEFLGEYHAAGAWARDHGNPGLPAPGFRIGASPQVQRIEARIRDLTPHAGWFLRVAAEFWWPCAPKAFRFLEKLLWCIGRERPVISLPSLPLAGPEDVPGFLHCEDTWPDQDAAAVWWREFLASLDGWWRGEDPAGPLSDDVRERLRGPTPAKRWLVRLLAHRLRMLERYGGSLGPLVNPPATSRRGTGVVR